MQQYRVQKVKSAQGLYRLMHRQNVKTKRGFKTAFICVAIVSGKKNSEALNEALNR